LQIQRVVDWVIEKKKKKIGVLGLSFKSDTDDLRESPIVNVIETLLGKGYAIAIYDSNVYISRLVGANRSYIEQVIPHISLLMKRNVKEVLDFAEVILVANKGAGFNEVLTWIRPDQVVLDLVRVTDELSMIKGKYEGICW
jgi:GDP-mannose 6-dehydrogenase